MSRTDPSLRWIAPLVLLAASSTAKAGEVTIDFDDISSSTLVGDQYDHVTFSSVPGMANYTLLSASASSAPNLLCTGTAPSSPNCDQDTVLTFDGPVNDLTFMAVGVTDTTGVVAHCDVYVAGQIVQTVQIQATGAHQQLVDLGAFEWITKIRLHNITDTFGLGWDDVSFTPVPVSADFDDVPKGTMLAEDHYLCLLLSSSAGAVTTSASGSTSPPSCVRLGAADAPDLSVKFPAPVERFGFRYEWKNATVAHPTFQVHVSVDGQFHVTHTVVGSASEFDEALAFFVEGPDLTEVRIDGLVGASVYVDDLVFEAPPAAAVNYGSGWPGTAGVPAFTMDDAPAIGTSPKLVATNASAVPTTALLLIGATEASIPTDKGGTVLATPSVVLSFPMPVSGFSLTAPIPNDAALCGKSIHLQLIHPDAGASHGYAFTEGLRLDISSH